MEFKCEYCNKSYQANKSLLRHLRFSHNSVGVHMRPGRKSKCASASSTNVSCDVCGSMFSRKSSLIRHCNHAKHLSTSMKIRRRLDILGSQKTVKAFKNIAEFYTWKACEEDATVSQFVKVRGDSFKKQVTYCSYYCHRSGRYVQKKNSLRHIKVQGSCKIGRICPASMFVKILPTGDVLLNYYSEHKGHDSEISHIRLRKQQREQIAVKLAAGVPCDEVLGSVRTIEKKSALTRLQLIKIKDIHNIAHEFGIEKCGVLHKKKNVDPDFHLENVPELSCEVTSVYQHVLPAINESDVNEKKLGRLQSSRDVEETRELSRLAWEKVHSVMNGHGKAIADVVLETMTGLSSLVTSLSDNQHSVEPKLPAILPSHKLPNKTAPRQGFLQSTQNCKQPKEQLTASEPTRRKRVSAVPLRWQSACDHTSTTDGPHAFACHILNIEHSYYAKQ